MSDYGPQFTRLLVKHDRALIKYIMTFIPKRDDAEEVLQNAATVIWEKFPEYDQKRDFLPWAMRITYFEVLNFRKCQARNRLVFSSELMELLAQDHAQREPVLEAIREALQACLSRLDSRAQGLLEQRYCDSQSVAKLALASGEAVESLYRRLHRLRQRVARCVQSQLAEKST